MKETSGNKKKGNIKSFFKGLLERLDKKMEENVKSTSSCCKPSGKDNNSCCS